MVQRWRSKGCLAGCVRVEGATNHCVMENRSLVGQVLFDWLDEVFKQA
jgi:hypothetical protein